MQIDRTKPSEAARLLSEVGARVSARLAERLAALDLTLAQLAVLRQIVQAPGSSQQAVAGRLGMTPSRVLKLVDELEQKHLIERRPSRRDRRRHELQIADKAQGRLAAVRQAVKEHEQELIDALEPDELETLIKLLRKLETAYESSKR